MVKKNQKHKIKDSKESFYLPWLASSPKDLVQPHKLFCVCLF